MSRLNLYIEELLLSYECVIIPEFGGFVANYSPAYIDERLKVFNPPSKRIIFNKNLSTNDGLLANYIAQKENLSFEQGMDIIKDFVRLSKLKLSAEERVGLDNIGFLYLDGEKNIQFVPKEDRNFLIDAFGLDSVYIEKLEKLSSSTVEEIKVIPVVEEVLGEVEEEDNIISIAPKKRIRFKHIAAAASISLVALYTAWVPLNNDILGGEFQWAKMNPFYETVEAKFEAESNLKEFSTDQIEIAEPELKEWVLQEFGIEPKETSEVIPASEKNFHVIGGCFGKKRYANKFLNRLLRKGYEASIVDKKKGLYRVAYGSFETKAIADKAMEKITAKTGKSAWILSK